MSSFAGTAVFVGLAAAHFLYCIGRALYNVYWHPLATYPGPFWRAAFCFPDNWSKLRGTSYVDIKSLHDQYGSVVRVAPNGLSYTTSQAWKDIYGMRQGRTELAKDPAYYKRDDAAVQILTANHAEHVRIRKKIAPAFSETTLKAQESMLSYYFDLLISKLKLRIDGPDHGRVDLMAYYNYTTFDIIGNLVHGESFGALESGEYHDWIRNAFATIKWLGIIRFVRNNPPLGMMFDCLRQTVPAFAARQKQHKQFTEDRLQKRLRSNADHNDCITYILHDRNDKQGLSYPDLLANSRILLTAGSETTATHLSGATWHMLTHPQVLSRAQDEIRTTFESSEQISLHALSTPGRLPYLEAVIKESFRCYPSLPSALPRITGPEGAMIDGRHVPGRVSVGVDQWAAYRSAANFRNPDEFAPERWLATPPTEYLGDDKDVLQPFHIGPRACLGQNLAYFEIRSILTRMLWHFEMTLEHESRDWLVGQKEYALWDKPSLWARLEHRQREIKQRNP